MCRTKIYQMFWLVSLVFFANQTTIFAQQKQQSVSRILADFTINTRTADISDKAFLKAKLAILDVLGNSMAGYEAPGISVIRKQMEEWGGKDEATVWFSGSKLPVLSAGFVNSAMAHALDFDDTHRPTNSHPSVVIIPTALSVGELTNASGLEILDAIVIGYEITNSIGTQFVKYRKHGAFLPSSVIVGFGATAVACRIMGLSVDETINAFGIYYAHASGNRQALFDHTLTKRIQPAIAVKSAIFAATLAQKGFTGPEDIFLSKAGLLRIYGGNLVDEMPPAHDFNKGASNWAIEKTAFKKYSACGASHPIIEAAISLSKKYNLTLEVIDSIELFGIFVGSGYVDNPWVDTDNPQPLAQFSAPYQVVSAIKNQEFGPSEITEKRILEDKEVSELAQKVMIKYEKEWGGSYPGGQAIRITTTDGRVLAANGTPQEMFDPDLFSMTDITDKFLASVKLSGLCKTKQAEKIVELVTDFEKLEHIDEFIANHLIFF